MRLPSLPRHRLAACALWVGLLASPGALAAVACDAEGPSGWRACRAALAQPLLERMLQVQERSRWCWAAALSMVFARYGHAVPQQEIVERMYGEAANVGIPTRQLLAVINRDWTSNGRLLRATTRHQVADAGATIPASVTLLASSLAQEQPVILSADGHAVVVVGITYQERGPWLRLTGGTVIDPRPGVGLRPLQAQELAVSVLASVDVAGVEGDGR